MITIGDTQYRNLEEQVEKNKNDILYMLEEEGVLNEFGIRVVGDVDASGDLPDPTTYEGEFGDAYAVGTQTPYTLYIFTRANGTHSTNYWFNIGQFPLAGPTGPRGPQGNPGQTGSSALVFSSSRTTSTEPISGTFFSAPSASYFDRTPIVGDYFLQLVIGSEGTSVDGRSWITNNIISSISGGAYNYQIRSAVETTGATGAPGMNGAMGPTGPMGPTGAQGATGTPGSPFIIQGIVSAENQLPAPSTIADNIAYLVGTAAPYDLYVQVQGDDTWLNVGQVEGVVGPTGPQGATGAAGTAGEQGPTGPTGATGPTGPQGLPGIAGANGEPGAIGPTGPAGPTGATGDQGPVGPVGGIGPTGPQGEVGPTGPQGPAGSTPEVNYTEVTGGTSWSSPVDLTTYETDEYNQLILAPGYYRIGTGISNSTFRNLNNIAANEIYFYKEPGVSNVKQYRIVNANFIGGYSKGYSNRFQIDYSTGYILVTSFKAVKNMVEECPDYVVDSNFSADYDFSSTLPQSIAGYTAICVIPVRGKRSITSYLDNTTTKNFNMALTSTPQSIQLFKDSLMSLRPDTNNVPGLTAGQMTVNYQIQSQSYSQTVTFQFVNGPQVIPMYVPGLNQAFSIILDMTFSVSTQEVMISVNKPSEISDITLVSIQNLRFTVSLAN